MLTYKKYPHLDFTLFLLAGDTTIEDWLKTVELYGREGMTRLELYDLRQQKQLFTAEDVRKLVMQTIKDKDLRPAGGKTAVLVKETFMFGLSRMYETMAELEGITSETRPFYDLNNAMQWLEIENESIVWPGEEV